MNQQEKERRARLLKMREERLPNIKKQFEEAQKRNFNSNYGMAYYRKRNCNYNTSYDYIFNYGF